jgi:FMN-dependent NADH-azoreductase
MPKLLYIEASPRKARSKSVEVAKAFLDTIRNANPSVEVDTLDLWSTELPRFDGSTIDAKYAILHGQPHTAEQAKAWKHVEDVIARFKAPDWYLFSASVLPKVIPVLSQERRRLRFTLGAAHMVPVREWKATTCKAKPWQEFLGLSASRT